MTRALVIDTDTASDDAVALMMALRHPEADVEAITVTAGNVPLEQAVQNALYTAELCGSSAPVYAGAARPLLQPPATAENVHGTDGMGDIGLPLAGRVPAPGNAVDVLMEAFLNRPGEVDLVTLGPLTNIAAALARRPRLAAAVGHCYIMGGTGSGTGNVTPLAEYNFWADPEAAAMVMRSPMPKTVIGWDISTASAVFDEAQAAEIRRIGTRYAETAIDIQGTVDHFAKTSTRLAGFDLPDPIAMAVALRPDIAVAEHVYVSVVAGSGPTRGVQSTDWRGLSGNEPNARVVTYVPRESFIALLRAGLS